MKTLTITEDKLMTLRMALQSYLRELWERNRKNVFSDPIRQSFLLLHHGMGQDHNANGGGRRVSGGSRLSFGDQQETSCSFRTDGGWLESAAPEG
jgi:hypothetical protein